MSDQPKAPPKKDVALALLAHSSVFVHLDPRMANVVVPVHFKRQPQLVLQIGLNMPVPIPDLHLDDDGMSCTLSFNRSPFHCMVPWRSIYAMVDDEGRAMVWPEDVPPEVQQQVRARTSPVTAVPGSRPPSTGPTAVPNRPQAVPSPARSKEPARETGAKDGAAPRQQRLRLADPPASAEGSGGAPAKGRPTKKGRAAEGSRLAAVPPPKPAADRPIPLRPSPAPAAATSEKKADRTPRDERGDAEERATGGQGHGPPASPPKRPTPPAGKKAKRELPPYLRVVK